MFQTNNGKENEISSVGYLLILSVPYRCVGRQEFKAHFGINTAEWTRQPVGTRIEDSQQNENAYISVSGYIMLNFFVNKDFR